MATVNKETKGAKIKFPSLEIESRKTTLERITAQSKKALFTMALVEPNYYLPNIFMHRNIIRLSSYRDEIEYE
jgi:hypothetical protein